MTLAAFHLFHRSIDLHKLAEREARDGGALALGGSLALVQRGGTSEACPSASSGPETSEGTSLKLIAGAAPSEGHPGTSQGANP